jgi:hypothetical protein
VQQGNSSGPYLSDVQQTSVDVRRLCDGAVGSPITGLLTPLYLVRESLACDGGGTGRDASNQARKANGLARKWCLTMVGRDAQRIVVEQTSVRSMPSWG